MQLRHSGLNASLVESSVGFDVIVVCFVFATALVLDMAIRQQAFIFLSIQQAGEPSSKAKRRPPYCQMNLARVLPLMALATYNSYLVVLQKSDSSHVAILFLEVTIYLILTLRNALTDFARVNQ